jgi:hypothetical protein
VNGARLRSRFALLIATLALLVAACGGESDAPPSDTSWSAQAIAPAQDSAGIPLFVNSSRLGVGANRIAFGFFDREGALLSEVTADVRLFTLDGDEGTFVSERALTRVALELGAVHEHDDGTLHDHSGATVALFVANVGFTRSGDWGAEVTIDLDGDRVATRLRFVVQERTPEPMIGDAIPRSVQRVLADVDAVEEIDSSLPPVPEMHDQTVAAALDAGRPMLVAFATSAFCQSRFCGPVIDGIVRPLLDRYGSEAAFIHIEPFDLAEARDAGRLVGLPVMAEWGLTTEPWVFIVDGDGRVSAKFEGIMSLAEVEAALAAVLE